MLFFIYITTGITLVLFLFFIYIQVKKYSKYSTHLKKVFWMLMMTELLLFGLAGIYLFAL
ncbi:hypothetical protein COB57_03555 [Candidatus Peregrinibacteria bacterium]|nr:MAG: hypothetical protein COB57_03555 [Candidatus Peregrinibacteria bacterium]